MIKFIERLHHRELIKESFDNLPSGVCFFDKNGLVVLSNHQMTRIILAMTGHDIQSIGELNHILDMDQTENGAIRDQSCFILPDGLAWSFSFHQITANDGHDYTEVIASNVTELREKQKLLIEFNEAKRQTISALESIQENVVSITREEEILSMKMNLHNEFGYNLQTIRKFFQDECPQKEKALFIKRQRKMIHKMQGELDNNDEIDPLNELEQLASTLDMKILYKGQKPTEKKYEHFFLMQ